MRDLRPHQPKAVAADGGHHVTDPATADGWNCHDVLKVSQVSFQSHLRSGDGQITLGLLRV